MVTLVTIFGIPKIILDNERMIGFVNILKSHDQDTVLTGLQFVEMALRIFPDSRGISKKLRVWHVWRALNTTVMKRYGSMLMNC